MKPQSDYKKTQKKLTLDLLRKEIFDLEKEVLERHEEDRLKVTRDNLRKV